MERRLFVLRHAKSSWDDPALADHDRPLNDRGRDALPKLERALHPHGAGIDVVLCSSATRTVATLEGIRGVLREDVAVVIDEDLYGARAATWLERCRRLDDTVTGALLVGHNPGVEELIVELTGSGQAEAIAQLDAKVPTGALACCSFNGAWAGLAADSCSLDALLIPRRLP